MLGDFDAHVDIGVKDLQKSTDFYRDTLGLKVLAESAWNVRLQSGDSVLNIYQSEYAGTNQATYCTWEVANVEETVSGLKGKGVTFEHHDMPGGTLQGDVHVMGDMKTAWFKDPDSNILCISNKG